MQLEQTREMFAPYGNFKRRPLTWHEQFRRRESRRIFVLARVSGKIRKPASCEQCGVAPENKAHLHGHHEDYAEPLRVRWLCRDCHRHQHA